MIRCHVWIARSSSDDVPLSGDFDFLRVPVIGEWVEFDEEDPPPTLDEHWHGYVLEVVDVVHQVCKSTLGPSASIRVKAVK